MLSNDEVERYSRNIIIREVGGKGQEKLKKSSVLVVGTGGLGSPAALYLAAAGIGRIGLVDNDSVDLSNLQRQILHRTEDIGRPKVDSGARTLQALNPHITVETHHLRVNKDNVLALISGYDIVIDAVDNFAARYLLNDACVLSGKIMVEAGVIRFDGLLTVISPGAGPCYRCIFPQPPAEGTVPTCSQAGVMGTVPGVMGTLQAMETIKLLLGIGEPLVGRMLLYDGLGASFRQVEWRRDSACPVCGEDPVITDLHEYHENCKADQNEN